MILPKNAILLALFSALLLWLSFPGGGGLWPLLFVALVPLLYAVQAAKTRLAVLCGFACGLVHFVLLLYWIIIVLGKYGGLPWFISLPALLFLALYMSIYLALFTVSARYIFLVYPAVLVLWLLPALWVGLDWLRSIVCTGFPWMDIGYALYRIPLLIQVADLLGHHGVTFIVVFSNTLIVLLLLRKNSFFSFAALLVSAGIVFGVAGAYSKVQLKMFDKIVATGKNPHLVVGIVQGNIDQSVKWSPARQQETVEKYLGLSKSLFAGKKPTCIVWPETALPFYPLSNPLMFKLWQFTTAHNTTLLTGAPWYERVDKKAGKIKYYNSALLLRPDGRWGGKYYKTHLVPFGEYVPLKKFLPFLAPLVEAVGDFSSGTIEKPFTWDKAKAGILICFESVFPDLSRRWVLSGANLLVNLTNDAWYGNSSAPYQSLAMVVFRAVESRRSIVRAANTGISAFIEPSGRISSKSVLFEPWAMAKDVVLLERKTFWVRYGYLFGPLCLFFSFCAVCVAGIRRKRKNIAVV